jgi:hypothetical protein
MRKWETPKTKFKNKAEKFSKKETKRCLAFIKSREWQKNLIT